MALADTLSDLAGPPLRLVSGTVTGLSGNRAVVTVDGAELTLPRLAWYPVTAGDTVNILASDIGWVVLGPVGAVTGGGGGAQGPAGRSVTSATITSGHLILTMSDSTTIDAGVVVGDSGPAGVSVTGAAVDGDGHLILTLSSGSTVDAGYVVGPSGAAADVPHARYYTAAATQFTFNGPRQRLPFATALSTHADVTAGGSGTTFTVNRAGVWRVETGVRLASTPPSTASQTKYLNISNSADLSLGGYAEVQEHRTVSGGSLAVSTTRRFAVGTVLCATLLIAGTNSTATIATDIPEVTFISFTWICP